MNDQLVTKPTDTSLANASREGLSDGSSAREDTELTASVLPVRIVRSARRKRTSQARIVDGVIEVRVPAAMPIDVETATVAKLVRRIRHKNAIAEAGLTGVDLEQRARRLAREYELPLPNSIGWVTNQKERFGSCSIDSGDIRISSRLAKVPLWVLDSVILHELTHLIEPGHSAEFYRLMRRYPNLDRADGFLDAMSLGHADPRWEP